MENVRHQSTKNNYFIPNSSLENVYKETVQRQNERKCENTKKCSIDPSTRKNDSVDRVRQGSICKAGVKHFELNRTVTEAEKQQRRKVREFNGISGTTIACVICAAGSAGSELVCSVTDALIARN